MVEMSSFTGSFYRALNQNNHRPLDLCPSAEEIIEYRNKSELCPSDYAKGSKILTIEVLRSSMKFDQKMCPAQPRLVAIGKDVEQPLSWSHGGWVRCSTKQSWETATGKEIVNSEKLPCFFNAGGSAGSLSLESFKSSADGSSLPVVGLALTQALGRCPDLLERPSDGHNESFEKCLAGKRDLDEAFTGDLNNATGTLATTDGRPLKKQQILGSCVIKETMNPVLHETCRARSSVLLGFVQKVLSAQPNLAWRRIRLQSEKLVYDSMTGMLQKQLVSELFSYPINLAIQYGADLDVLTSLVEAAPHVLGLQDGYLEQTSLHILLHHRPMDTAALDLILFQNPYGVSTRDKKNNTPLHTACAWGASLTSVRHLVIMYPEALHERNFHGQTPLQVAQHAYFPCSDEVASFLWSTLNERPTDVLL